jgi:hypothetical protein
MKKLWIFVVSMAVGLTTLSLALGSVPSTITDDTALYQKLSEIRIPKEDQPNFDIDITRLSKLEGRYAEHLPPLSGAMARVAKQKYQYSGQNVGKKTANASEKPAARD